VPIRLIPVSLVLCGIALAGCGGDPPQVTRYRAVKPQVLWEANHVDRDDVGAAHATPGTPVTPSRPARPTRMLAAAVPQGKLTWFFKLTGPPADVAKQREPFEQLVRSIRFEGAGPPAWTLPDGWRRDERPTSAMRFATLRTAKDDGADGGEGGLEISVIPLPSDEDDPAGYLLSNVNRWRGQLGLPRLEAEQLADETERLELEGASATLVDFTGRSAAGGRPMAGPFAAERPGPQLPPGGGARPRPAAPAPLVYEVPSGWREKPAGGMRKAAFEVGDDGRTVDVTVIDLPAGAGSLLQNVNRWRGQIGLSDFDEAALQEAVSPLKIDGRPADYVRLAGPESADPRESILAAVVTTDDRTWFVKLKGDAALADREQDRFKAFLASLRFQETTDDGR